MDKQKITIVILSAALFLVGQYVIIQAWFGGQQEKILENYRLAYNQGIKDTVNALYQQTENCNTAMVKVGNFTRYLSDITCLQSNSKK